MAVGCSTFSSDDIVIKPPNDKRLYRYIQLANGLCALLIHDPEIYSGSDEHADDAITSEGSEASDDDDDEEDDDVEDEESDENEEEEGDEVKKGSSQKKAAAAMCVGMGSFEDPCEAQGLAHFLEHMLFMGSTDFPDENEYDSYLSKHGGSSNAYTETDHTCYHFDVKREFLHGALKRFSQFFISPLVKADAMEREVLAVDSEFNQVVQSDPCRLQQLQCHTSTPGHPFNRFFWGNKKSLVDAMEKGIDLREQILRLYNDNYHAGMMKLVIIGGESLDILESWVLELFSNVRKGVRATSVMRSELPIWKSGKVYWLEAVKDVHILELAWTLPSLRLDYLKKVEDYLAHLLGHEGRGSLHHFLKARGLATTISAGVGDDGMQRSSVAYIFSMSIHLTDSGFEKIFDVIGFVYQYIKLLRQVSPQEWIFRELKDIADVDFRFVEEQPQDEYAAELAGNLLIYPPKHIIYCDYAYEFWDEEKIKYVLDFFKPENMRVDVLSKTLNKSQGIQLEPWFGSQFTEEDIPSLLMDVWRDPPEIETSLHLPVKNEFIPRDFCIRADKMSDMVDSSSPRCILDEPLLKMWYKLDTTYKVPRANTYFRITLNGGCSSLKNALLTELFVHLLKDELNETVYQASVAKLETSVSLYGDKLELKIYGFNDKLPVLLTKILATVKSFSPKEDRFMDIKEDIERTLRNANMKPLSHSAYLRLQILCQCFWDVEEKLNMLHNLSLAELRDFIPSLISQLYIEGLCHGNLLEEEAVEISSIIKSALSVVPLPLEMRYKENILCLPCSADLIRDVEVKNKSETNSVVELYYQIEPEIGTELIKLKAIVDLFDEIMEEPFFNQLRTKEQLGYVVDCSPRVTYRVMGFCFRVQSSEYNPVYLLGRIDNFINGVEEMLVFDKRPGKDSNVSEASQSIPPTTPYNSRSVPATHSSKNSTRNREEILELFPGKAALDIESFESYKNGLIGKLLEKEPSLSYETNKFWGQIVDKRYMFDLPEKESEVLSNIKKDDIIEWYRTYLKRPSTNCRRLAIRVWGCNSDSRDADTEMISGQNIKDVEGFKKLCTFYPSMC